MKKYIYTDLACESNANLDNIEGTIYSYKKFENCELESLEIITEGASLFLGRKKGKYITIKSAKIQNLSDTDIIILQGILSSLISEMTKSLIKKAKYLHCPSVLIVGLGNNEITSDAIGPKSINKICVTRHIKRCNKKLFDSLELCEISAFAPNVFSKTGIESFDVIKSVVENINPDIIIVIDSLAAKSISRLASTIQITNTGITPGSGLGSRKSEICYETFHIPVIAIGIPTVVNSTTMVYDALNQTDLTDFCADYIMENLEKSSKIQDEFFVTPKESDIIVEKASDLISNAINEAFSNCNN